MRKCVESDSYRAERPRQYASIATTTRRKDQLYACAVPEMHILIDHCALILLTFLLVGLCQPRQKRAPVMTGGYCWLI